MVKMLESNILLGTLDNTSDEFIDNGVNWRHKVSKAIHLKELETVKCQSLEQNLHGNRLAMARNYLLNLKSVTWYE